MTIEAAQIRAGRALIGWSQAELANAAGLAPATVELLETSGDNVSTEAVGKLRAALEAGGVAFVPEGGGSGAGVRFRGGRESKYLGWEDLNASNDE
jgi:transcriptional regulator with XRE-family HTH domain